MSRHSPPAVASWLLETVVPERNREAVLGDLIEEFTIRTESDRPRAASLWYWEQVCRSIPRMLWTSMQEEWLRALPIAISAYIAAGMLEFVVTTQISRLFSLGAPFDTVVSMIVGLTTMVFAGYIAARIRPAAATVVASIAFIVVAALMMTRSDTAPLWYQLAFLTAGPLAPLMGGALCLRRTRVGRPV